MSHQAPMPILRRAAALAATLAIVVSIALALPVGPGASAPVSAAGACPDIGSADYPAYDYAVSRFVDAGNAGLDELVFQHC